MEKLLPFPLVPALPDNVRNSELEPSHTIAPAFLAPSAQVRLASFIHKGEELHWINLKASIAISEIVRNCQIKVSKILYLLRF